MNAFSREWIPDYGGGSVSLSGEISTDGTFDAPSARSRRAERVTVAFGAGLRQRGASGVTVQILDLSTDGFRVATHLELSMGTDVWLRLPGLEPSHARVVWSDARFLGCAFVRPLHPAVVDMLVARSKGH